MADIKHWLFKKHLPEWGYLLALVIMGGLFLWLVWSATDVLK